MYIDIWGICRMPPSRVPTLGSDLDSPHSLATAPGESRQRLNYRWSRREEPIPSSSVHRMKVLTWTLQCNSFFGFVAVMYHIPYALIVLYIYIYTYTYTYVYVYTHIYIHTLFLYHLFWGWEKIHRAGKRELHRKVHGGSGLQNRASHQLQPC